MIGATAGMAAAASYPMPFVQNGGASVAIVVGANAALSDGLAATRVSSDLATELAAQTATGGSGSSSSVSGDAVSLDTSADRIWLNTSLNSVKSTLSSSDLKVVLADSTFDGDVSAKLTSTIKFNASNPAGGDNSGSVIFSKQPKSSNDPIIGLSLGTAANTYPLYNATVTFDKAVNFTDSDSQGETIHLFGNDFVVSTETDTASLVLYKSAQQVTLTVGGSNPNPTATVNIDGTDYEITLTNGDSTTAYLTVNGDSKSVNEGNSRKVGGVEVAVKDVVAGSDSVGTTATVLVGAQKLTFTNGTTVTQGSDDENIEGTTGFIIGGPTAATALTVSVFRQDSSNDAVLPGTPFVDPVFGSFKVDLTGISSPLDDSNREKISIENSGDDTAELSFVDSEGNSNSISFAYNDSTYGLYLADDSGNNITVVESGNLTVDDYVILGNEDYGHLLQVDTIRNNSNTLSNNKVTFVDTATSTKYDLTAVTATSTGASGTLTIDGKQYTVTFKGEGDGGSARVKYPTGDSSASQFVLFPNIQTKNGALVSLYQPTTLNLDSMDGAGTNAGSILLPDGDGYTTIAIIAPLIADVSSSWKIGGTNLTTNATANTVGVVVSAGKLTYNFTSTGANNATKVFLVDPDGTAAITKPSVVIFEGKNDDSVYDAIAIDLENGDSDADVGVNSISFNSTTHYSATLQSDSDITQDVDWWGTLATTDASQSNQKTVEVSYPSSQVYANIFIGETGASISTSTNGGSATSLGSVTVRDSEISSVSGKNLIVIGGSCINSIAASLLGGASCGAAFTSATGISAGEALIKSFDRSGKVALLVAGYNAEDTDKAITYLVNNAVNTTVGSAGMKVTSATQATALTA